jgi:hypothetical protein
MQVLATYPSSHAALRAEGQLRADGIAVELIPVPRQVRSTCGFCLLAEVEDPGPLRASGAEGLWRVTETDNHPRRTYDPIQ